MAVSIESIRAAVVAAGLPEETADTFLTALDSAGGAVVDQTSGDPLAVNGPVTDKQVLSIPGLAGVYVVGVRLGTRGWVVRWWHLDSKQWSAPVFLEGDGDLQPA